MKRAVVLVVTLLLATSQSHAARDGSDEMLDAVLEKYKSASGGVDWNRLRRDLASRKSDKTRLQQTVPTSRPIVVTVAPPGAAKLTPIAPPSFDDRPTGVLLVRDAYSNQAFISEKDDLSDNGASLNYTQDSTTNKQTIAGKGAVFYALSQWVAPTTVDPNVLRVAHYAIVPGVEWDLKSRSRLNDFSGSASALFGAEYMLRSGWFDLSFLKVNASYTTDVATGSAKVYGGELSWQPIILEHGIGTTRRLSRELDMWAEFVPTLNADFFHVGGSGDFSNLVTGRDYLWTGAKLSGRLFFKSGLLERYSLLFKYYYLYDALHRGSQNVDYKQVTAKAKVLEWKDPIQKTNTGDLSLTLRYTKGTTQRTLEKNDEIFAGLTLKVGSLPTEEKKTTE